MSVHVFVFSNADLKFLSKIYSYAQTWVRTYTKESKI